LAVNVRVLPYEQVLYPLLDGSLVIACPQQQLEDTFSSVTLDILGKLLVWVFIYLGVCDCVCACSWRYMFI